MAVASPHAELVERLRGASPEVIRAALRGMGQDDQLHIAAALFRQLDPMSRHQLSEATMRLAETWRPTTDEELWDAYKDLCGMRIPRVGVCQGHCAPFEFARDVYFELGLPDKLAIGNRGSGKTQIMGATHALNARTKPKHEGTTVGAVLAQSERCKKYFQAIAKPWRGLYTKMQARLAEFRNGAVVEIVVGSITGVNSPHPNLAHFDEVELFRPGVFEEGLNMAQSSNGYRAMNVLTSSWKKSSGFVSQLLDEVAKAAAAGRDAPYQVYRWCVFETTERCPDECARCPYRNVVKGEWPDGSPRSFEQVCKQGSPEPGVGKLKFADGFVAIEDAVARFRKLSRRMWESQQESKKPTMEGLIYDNWDEDLYTVWEWTPDPLLGEIDVSVDYGGTDPFAIEFWQTLAEDTEWDGRVLPKGAAVMFDLLYPDDIGNVTAAVMLNERIAEWDEIVPGFADHLGKVYRDVAAASAARDWRKLSSYGTGPGYRDIHTVARGGVKIKDRIALVYELIGEGFVYIDAARCQPALDEIGGYEWNPVTGKPVGGDDHALDSLGYFFWNRHVERRVARRQNTDTALWQRRQGLRAPAANRAWQRESPVEIMAPRALRRGGTAVAIPRNRERLEM